MSDGRSRGSAWASAERALSASSLPSSMSLNALLISCVKKVREVVMVVCTLWSNSHLPRGFSSYAATAALYSALSASRMASTTFCSQISTAPSHLQGPANSTYSFSPAVWADPWSATQSQSLKRAEQASAHPSTCQWRWWWAPLGHPSRTPGCARCQSSWAGACRSIAAGCIAVSALVLVAEREVAFHLKMSCGSEPLERMSRRSAGATK